MFCHNCGSAVDDDSVFCNSCGTKLNFAPQKSTQQPQGSTAANTNIIAIVGFILSFFVAIAGLICSIIGFQNAQKGAPHKGLAIAGIIISVVWIGFVAALSVALA